MIKIRLPRPSHLPLPAQPDPALSVTNLDLRIHDRQILRQMSFCLPHRGITCLIGPSGAGKSSLLRCLNLLQESWKGEVSFQGRSIRSWPGGTSALRRQIGLIGQKPVVFPGTIQANLIFGLPRRERRRMGARQIKDTLHQVGLWQEVGDRLASPAAHLSQGQQQRLCIARALILEPAILLLDEPTASLDRISRQIIEDSIATLAQSLPVLWVTHDLQQCRRVASHVIFLCDGRLIEAGASQALFDQPQKLETREFIHWQVCECDSEISQSRPD